LSCVFREFRARFFFNIFAINFPFITCSSAYVHYVKILLNLYASMKQSPLCLLAFFFLFVSILPSQAFAAAPVVPTGFQVNTVIAGLNLPTAFAFTTDGRIFIAQKSGAVRVVKNGQLLATPLVTLTDVNDYGDRGLEGIAVDPNFAQNGYVYLAYTHENTPGQNYEGPKTGRIVRLTVAGDTANLSSEVVLVGTVGGDAANPSCNNYATTSDCIPSDSSAHSMGALRFGPDGKLWASIGDGSGFENADPNALHSQDIQSLAGKMLRINTDGTGPGNNPFYNGDPNANQSKVWSIGHRNSYRFNFRPSDGKLFFGEVGWANWEEVDISAAGANYGWPCREGYVSTSYNCTPSSATTDPIYVYDHHTSTASVIGGVFAPAGTYPASYAGNYFFADYSNDLIKRMVLTSSDTVASVEDFVTSAGGPVDINLGPDGQIYYLALNKGELRTLIYSTANRAPIAVINASPTAGPSPLTVNFSSAASSDPDGDAFSTAWNFGDGNTSSSTNPTHTYNTNGDYTVTLTVTDTHNASSQSTSVIRVGQQQQPGANPTHVSTTIDPTPVVIGHVDTITTTVHNTGDPNPFIVDMEVYDSSGNQVSQKVYDSQTIPTNGTSQYTAQWLPPAVGNYTVKVGLFKENWAGVYQWTDNALSVTVLNRAPTSGPPSFSQTTTATQSPNVGSTDTISTTIQNTGTAADALIDIEAYKDGTKVGQKVFDNQHFDTNQSQTFSFPFTPTTAGAYTVSVGVFQPAWASLYSWFDKVAGFATGSGGGTGTTTGSTPNIIYDDALASGWENWSWGSAVSLADGLAYAGTHSIKVAYQSAWAGLYLHSTNGFNTNGKTSLSFAVNGGANGANLQVYTYDANGTPSSAKNLSSYITGGVTANTWKQVTIPLSDIGAQNKVITGIVIQDASGSGGASVNVDSVQMQ
jgi:glucose/arabinose dehydrogenase